MSNDNPQLPTPDLDEIETERQIQAAGLTAPRVTPADIDAEIQAGTITYFTAAEGVSGGIALDDLEKHGRYSSAIRLAALNPLQRKTFCVITLANGFSVTGESACVDPRNFNPQIGRDIAYRNARRQLWPLLGFRLADKLHACKTLGIPPETSLVYGTVHEVDPGLVPVSTIDQFLPPEDDTNDVPNR